MRIAPLVPWVISLSLHALLISGGVLAVRSVTTRNGPPPEPAIVSFRNPAPAGVQLVEPAPVPKPEPIDKPIPVAATAQRVAQPEPGIAARRELAEPVEPLLKPSTPAGVQLAPVDAEALVRAAQTPEVSFAGLGSGNATTIVYVVAGSGSMVGSLPIVLDELERSLRQLAPTQKFQVVFFRNVRGADFVAAPAPPVKEATPGEPPRLIRATRENVDAVVGWMRTVIPSGRGNPIPALKAALSLAPDAVFVLSKDITGIGEWEPDKAQLLAELDALNPRDPRNGKRPVTIKTIQFLDRDPQGVLEAIGLLHGGEDGFNFVTREELKLQ